MVLLAIAGVVMAILAVLFAFQNAAVVTINFGVWQLEQSLAFVLIATLGLGIIISILLSLPTILKRGWQNSQQKHKILELQNKLRSTNQATFQEQQQSLAQQEATQELLQAFALADGVTGVLNKDTSIKLTEHLLLQMQKQSKNPRYSSLVAILFSVDPAKSRRNLADVGSENALYKAIAKRFRNAVTPNTFLGITERKRFIGLILGLKGTQVTDYVAYLQEQITASPLQKADGVLLPLKVSAGGVVVDPTDLVAGRAVLKQAEHNLEVALQQGRGSLEISEVASKTS